MADYGMKIKSKRLELKLTQQELALIIGCSRKTIIDYEKGKVKSPSKLMTTAFAKAFSVSEDELF